MPKIAQSCHVPLQKCCESVARQFLQQPEEFEGWNGDLLVFIGWSLVWQRKYRDAAMVRRLAIDPHSPSHFRANGAVMNVDAFYSAFNVKEGDLLFKTPAERIRIW